MRDLYLSAAQKSPLRTDGRETTVVAYGPEVTPVANNPVVFEERI